MRALYVVATAGHVDHGKSTLVRALTGMEPDRWAEERRRGLTIDLGFAWSRLPSGESLAFVDVPGHERFVGNMLAGVGPVPAVMFAVAADEGWMPQSAEHLDALAALGVRHGVLVVTRSDLADPEPVLARARRELAGTPLADAECRSVSGASGAGIDELRHALDRMVARLPAPDVDAAVRLWVDRAFTVRGAGTVVTGTLAAGALRTGDELVLSPGGERVRVRGLQSLREPSDTVAAMSRVAVNLRGIERQRIRRGMALLSPRAWITTDVVDVRMRRAAGPVDSLPREVTVHLGTAAVTARSRPLGTDTLRLALASPLPLRIGDVAILRAPGARAIAGGAVVLDVRPPELVRRRAAAARAEELSRVPDAPDGAGELARRGHLRRADLLAMGCAEPDAVSVDDWLVDPGHWAQWRRRLVREVGAYASAHPLDPRMPAKAARRALGIPTARMLDRLVAESRADGLVTRDGWLSPGDAALELPRHVRAALAKLVRELDENPFLAPAVAQLAEWGLDKKSLGAAVRAGQLVRLADGVYLRPDAPSRAARALCGIEQPFTVAQARSTLGTTRRVAVPLLEFLDARGTTIRVGNTCRYVRELAPATGELGRQ